MYLDDAEHCGGFEMPQEPYPSFVEPRRKGGLTQGCKVQIRQVRFANSDTLVGVDHGVDNRGGEWKALVQYYAPPIVLLSTGPHINRPPPLRTVDFTAILSQISQEQLERFPNVTLIWKTQAPGGCTEGISETFPRKYLKPQIVVCRRRT
jgi:hypothetical protein